MAGVIHILSACLRRHWAVSSFVCCTPTGVVGAEGNDYVFHELYFLPQKFALNKFFGVVAGMIHFDWQNPLKKSAHVL